MKQYIVDAFTDKIFSGNPAAICISDKWIPDEVMLNIACENNLSETAFAVKDNNIYRLRWFTPGGEIDLCGHATLACAYVILNFIEKGNDTVTFHTLSGKLTVFKKCEIYEMNFPAYDLKPSEITDEFSEALGAVPSEVYIGRDTLCIFDDENTVRNMTPNFEKVKGLEGLLLHVTAPGKNFDCVSRSFGPKCNVPEDAVCGSGHCHIIPYWSKKLNKSNIIAFQASKRSGILYCTMKENRIILGGKAALFSVSEIFLDTVL